MTFREQYFADLYRNYLSLDEEGIEALEVEPAFEFSDGATWPTNEEVPRICPHDDGESALPMIAIVANEEKTKHPYLLQAEVFVRLQIQSQLKDGEPVPDGEEDPVDRAGTATETAQKWMQAISEMIYSTALFRAFLLSLSQAERTGGEIMLRLPDNGVAHVHDAANRTHTWELRIDHKVDVSPPDE